MRGLHRRAAAAAADLPPALSRDARQATVPGEPGGRRSRRGLTPRSDASDSANPDPFAQDEPAAWTAGAGSAGTAPDPHAAIASRPASRKLTDISIPQRMFL